ncbi:unnamed protein product [Prorocentrum cordatum]|uniref:Uncharacterized protein n=1 Tax=Prorocentrum cordatum TaxID=2364126 RepID=A0ABN9Q2P9_9DINO|nr:unnamed protein product [Polarella glacialis]
MPHVRSASARIMRRALAVQNGYCVHLPIRLPLGGLVPPTYLPPPGLERATADLVLDYLLLRDPPVVKPSLEEEEADIATVSENLSCRMQASESLVDVGIGVQASESLVDVGVQTVDTRLAEEEVEATVATISETLSCRSLVDSGVQTDDACLTVLPKEEAAVATHSTVRQSEEEFQAVPPDSKRSDGKGDVRGHRKGRGKGQRYHSSAKPAKNSKGANIVFDEVYRFGRTLTDFERRCKSQVWPLR